MKGYQTAIQTYRSAMRLAAFFGYGKARRFFHKLDPDTAPLKGESVIWMHAASAGEGNQAAPLAVALRKETGMKVAITFFSPSGYAFHKNNKAFDIVWRLPLDTRKNAESFVRSLRPKLAVFIRNELWWNYLDVLQGLKIPAYLINAPDHLLHAGFPKGYYIRACLSKFQRIFPLSHQSRPAPEKLPVAGFHCDTKWEAARRMERRKDPVLAAFFGDAIAVVAGSSWPEEEKLLLKWLSTAKAEKVRVVIASHDNSEARVARLCETFRAVRYSEYGQNMPKDGTVMILDTYGLLSSAYSFADIALVGGGFRRGIHNILEPAVQGVPVLFGPRHSKFPEASALLDEALAFCIADEAEFQRVMDRLVTEESYRNGLREGLLRFSGERAGCAQRIASEILSDITPRISGE